MSEPAITINGVPLTEAQAMTVRVAIGSFAIDMQHDDALGDDKHGRNMTAAYRGRLTEVSKLMHKK